MGDYGIAVTWGDLKSGRESKVMEYFGEATAFSDKAVAVGRIERWDVALFESSGAHPYGAVRYYGTAEQITALAASDEFLGTVFRGQLLFVGFGFRRFVTGDVLIHAIGHAAEQIEAL